MEGQSSKYHSKTLRDWLSDRLPLRETVQILKEKKVPRHRHSLWYYFGGLTLFFLLVQFATGILLAVYYRPTPEHAYESVEIIMYVAPYGWLVRSVHSWAANLMVATMLVHMFSAFLMKAYRRPRELVWVSGAALLFLVLGFGFTGYLLPWDTTAYFATLVGTEIPKSVPVIGEWVVGLLRGGQDLGADTLTRMYTLHIIVLPLLAILLASFHVLLNVYYGSSVPPGTVEKKPPFSFYPDFVYRDALAWVVGLAALAALSTVFPWGLGPKADPLASAPIGIKPEWYFLPLFQSLRIVPGTVFSLNGELLVNTIAVVAMGLWVAVPFVDRNAGKTLLSNIFTIIGVLMISYLVMTVWFGAVA